MAEYIEREALLDRMNDYCVKNCHDTTYCISCFMTDAKEIVDSQDAEDVRPVVRSEWQEKAVWDDVVFVCSNCGEPWTLIEGTPEQNNMNFCPNCGSKMGSIVIPAEEGEHTMEEFMYGQNLGNPEDGSL